MFFRKKHQDQMKEILDSVLSIRNRCNKKECEKEFDTEYFVGFLHELKEINYQILENIDKILKKESDVKTKKITKKSKKSDLP